MTDNRMELYNPLRSSSLDFCNGYNNAVHKANDIIELLDIKNTHLAELLAEADKKNEELNAENERLKEKIIEDAKLLNDRVIQSVNAVSKAHLKYEKALEENLKTAKADAIKEFAERLKEYSEWHSYVTPRDIDHLVKKMVGDTDA